MNSVADRQVDRLTERRYEAHVNTISFSYNSALEFSLTSCSQVEKNIINYIFLLTLPLLCLFSPFSPISDIDFSFLFFFLFFFHSRPPSRLTLDSWIPCSLLLLFPMLPFISFYWPGLLVCLPSASINRPPHPPDLLCPFSSALCFCLPCVPMLFHLSSPSFAFPLFIISFLPIVSVSFIATLCQSLPYSSLASAHVPSLTSSLIFPSTLSLPPAAQFPEAQGSWCRHLVLDSTPSQTRWSTEGGVLIH